MKAAGCVPFLWLVDDKLTGWCSGNLVSAWSCHSPAWVWALVLQKSSKIVVACVCVQLCLTLWDPMECSPPGSSVHGISQARILEWVAVSFSRGSSWMRSRTHVSFIASGFFTTEPCCRYIPWGGTSTCDPSKAPSFLDCSSLVSASPPFSD